MPDNRRNAHVSNPSHPFVDDINEAIRRLRIQTSEIQGGGGDSSAYPDRPGEPDCIYYMRTGVCGYGANCRFNHPSNLGQIGTYGGELPERVGQPECGYFLKTGTCKYGSSCKYHHPRDRHGAGPVILNTLGLPMRQEEKSCPYYMRTGACKFGIACKFHHPQPASTGSALPTPGPAAYQSTGLSILPSPGLSYAGGVPAWSLTKATYLSAPPLSEGTHTYMPVVYPPPPQGMVPAPGWSTYMGSMSPVSSTNVYGDPGYSGQVAPPSSAVSRLPERPDRPECRHFMNNGSCKYGSDCKYNHPREKVPLLAASSLGPLGLPLRPGQTVCSYYSLYGLCKYGPTCKYDHPLFGYSYNYSLNMPNLSIVDPTLFSYQRNSVMIHSSEASPLKSPKFPEWIGKLESPSNKKLNAEESPENAGSPSHSVPTSKELLHDHSDEI